MSWNGTLLGDIFEELEYRYVYKSRELLPAFLSSFACHLIHLHNTKNNIYFENVKIPNLRLHVLMVAPPGFSKSFYLETLLNGKYCILGDVVKKTFEAGLSEAGLVGTIKTVDNKPVITDGLAKKYSDGIVATEEFEGITQMMQTIHSGNMDKHLLNILESGRVSKRLGPGSFKYNTCMTFWGGTQPDRFNLTSGLGRRFCYVVFIPNPLDRDMIRKFRQKGKNLTPRFEELDKLHSKIRKFKAEVSEIKKINFYTDEVLGKFRIPHFEESIYERLILGLTLLKGVDEVVDVELKDPELIKIIKQQISFRQDINMGGDFTQILRIIEYLIVNGHRKELGFDRHKIIDECSIFGWGPREVNKTLEEMRKANIINIIGQKIKLV